MAHTNSWRRRFVEAWALFDQIEGDRTRAQDFAGALGWPQATFSDISSAESPPPPHRVEDVSRVTGLHPGWLTYGVEPKYLTDAPPVAQNAPRGAGSGDASVVAVPRGKPLKGKRRAG